MTGIPLRPFHSLKTHYLSCTVFKDPFCHTDSTYFTASLMYVVSWCSLSTCKNFFHYISCWLPPPCGQKELKHNTPADVTSWGLVYNTVIISVCCLLTLLTSSPPHNIIKHLCTLRFPARRTNLRKLWVFIEALLRTFQWLLPTVYPEPEERMWVSTSVFTACVISPSYSFLACVLSSLLSSSHSPRFPKHLVALVFLQN